MVDGAPRALGTKIAAKELGLVVEDLSVEMVADSSGSDILRIKAGIKPQFFKIEVERLLAAAGSGRIVSKSGRYLGIFWSSLQKYKGVRDEEEQVRRVNVHVIARGCDKGGVGWRGSDEIGALETSCT